MSDPLRTFGEASRSLGTGSVSVLELVRAFADPAAGRHSLQLEINKRLYMDEAAREKHHGFGLLQQRLMTLLQAITREFAPRRRDA